MMTLGRGHSMMPIDSMMMIVIIITFCDYARSSGSGTAYKMAGIMALRWRG